MRKLYVPISLDPNLDHAKYLQDLKELGVDHVFFSETPFRMAVTEHGERWDAFMANMKKQLELYAAHGFETGVWVATLGYGGPLMGSKPGKKPYTSIRSVVGKVAGDAICPFDDEFAAHVCTLIQDIARNGARMIMLDDELCLSVRPGLGCACDLHLAEFSRRMGEEIGLAGLPERLFTGKATDYRRTWQDLQGETLKEFCRTLRRALDEVDPTVRMGFCAGYTSWDVEGVDALELTYILAGNTKPFLRFTAAPYWFQAQRFGQAPLQSISEFARMQAAWCEGKGVEVFVECDTYPHDCYHTPRSHIEFFDASTMLSKNVGCLKYLYHYPCTPNADRRYVKAHQAAEGVYKALQNAFHTRPEVGVRVYEEMHKFKEATLPEKFDAVKSQKLLMQKFSFSEAQAMLTANAIPTVYSGKGLCGICFGENARYLPADALEKGMILDLEAAELLQQQGIDVGLRDKRPLTFGGIEDFGDGEDPITNYWSTDLYELTLDAKATPLSYFLSTDYLEQPQRAPAAYLYENENGQRFLVYAFRAFSQPVTSGMYWSYKRGEQIAKAIPWLGGSELPATTFGNPFLYALCNEDEKGIAVAYFNGSDDAISAATVHFANALKEAKLIGGKGELLDAHTVRIDALPAFGYVAIEAEYQ